MIEPNMNEPMIPAIMNQMPIRAPPFSGVFAYIIIPIIRKNSPTPIAPGRESKYGSKNHLAGFDVSFININIAGILLMCFPPPCCHLVQEDY